MAMGSAFSRGPLWNVPPLVGMKMTSEGWSQRFLAFDILSTMINQRLTKQKSEVDLLKLLMCTERKVRLSIKYNTFYTCSNII